MSLEQALSIATGGLANINAQFALVSHNVANAGTAGYASEIGNQQALTADGSGLGVLARPATLRIDKALQSSILQQNAVVSGDQTTQTALQAVDSVLGVPGSGNDLGSLLGNLQVSFSTLLTDPSSQVQQASVVSTSATLAKGINQLSATYTAQRQAAQDAIASGVNTLNSTLATIGQLSNQIIALKPTDAGTADLENQRNAAVQTLSQLLDIKTSEQPNGDLTVFTSSGLTLPIRSTSGPFSFSNASTFPESFYPGGELPAVTLAGQDVTNQMAGGQIGANIKLRDTILPTDQAELDELAFGLSSRFAAQGLTLFTDPSETVPPGGGSPSQDGYIGYAATIQVNPKVRATPSLVRDGTDAVVGSPTGAAAFTPNPPSGPAGFTTLISNILSYTFGSQAQSGVPQPSLNTVGLGASGNLEASFSAGRTLSEFATGLVSSQAQQSAAITRDLSTEQSLQGSLTAKFSAMSGVNMDNEMSLMLSLQNAYAANARVITAVQNMFTQLLQTIP